jgi:outer membrane biosynthesis protein TonB
MSGLPSTEPPRFRPPKRKQLWVRIIIGTLAMSAAVILILPFTQALTAGNKERNIFQVQTANIPPPEPPPPEPPPPPEEEEPEEQPELDEPPPMMDISALESSLNPSMGGVGVGGIDFGNMEGKSTVEEAIFFSLRDLDRSPELIRGNPQEILRAIPQEFRTRSIDVELRFRIEIGPNGRLRVLGIEGAPSDKFGDAVRQVIEDWQYTSPTVDGEPVSVRYILPIPISL